MVALSAAEGEGAPARTEQATSASRQAGSVMLPVFPDARPRLTRLDRRPRPGRARASTSQRIRRAVENQKCMASAQKGKRVQRKITTRETDRDRKEGFRREASLRGAARGPQHDDDGARLGRGMRAGQTSTNRSTVDPLSSR